MALLVRNAQGARNAKVLIFSPPGHGKTHFLGSAQDDPRTYPMLLLDFEGGHETLAGLDMDIVEIRSWDDYSEVYEALHSGEHWKLPGSTLKDGEAYKSLGIDSISETHIWALLEIVNRKGYDERGKAIRKEPDLIEMGDYGIASTQMRRLLREFRDLPLHVFYTAHDNEREERGIGKIKVPKMSGQMADEVVGLMSIVGYLALTPEDENSDRLLLLQNYPGFRTKVRAPWAQIPPDEIADPTVTKLLDALQFEPPETEPAKRRRNTTKED